MLRKKGKSGRSLGRADDTKAYVTVTAFLYPNGSLMTGPNEDLALKETKTGRDPHTGAGEYADCRFSKCRRKKITVRRLNQQD